MMMKRTATIELSGAHPTCFASISWPMTLKGADSSIKTLKLETISGSPSTHFVSVISSGSSTSSKPGAVKDVIKLHPRFANSLGLRENDQVFGVEVTCEPTPVQSASVSCVSSDDWEILESNAEIVTNELLNQLRVVYPGLQFPFWVTKSMSINLKIDKISPSAEFGILASQSEIIIPSLTSPTSQVGSRLLHLKNYLRLRVHPTVIPDSVLSLLPSSSLLVKKVYNVFLHKCSITGSLEFGNFKDFDSKIPPSFSANLFPVDADGRNKNGKESESLKVECFFIEICDLHPNLLKFFPVTNPPCVYLHPELIKREELSAKSYVWIKQIENFGSNAGDSTLPQLAILANPDLEEGLDNIISFKNIIEECTSFLNASLSLGELKHSFVGPEFGSLLIEGKQGSGKSWLASHLAQKLESHPYFVHWELINCSKWRGKKAETMEKELKLILEICTLMRPAIVILDDLDVLTPMAKTEQQNVQEEFLYYKICETFLDSLMEHKGQELAIICTAVSKERLNSYWKSRGGFHFFQKVVSIPPPNQLERLSIFVNCLNRYEKSSVSALPLTPQPIKNVVNTPSQNREVKPLKKESTLTKISDPEELPVVVGTTNPSIKSDELMTSKILKCLSAIHDNYATPQLIHNLARRWAIYLSYTKENVELSEQIETLEQFIQEEIKFNDVSGSQKTSGANNKPISWDSIGGLCTVKQELIKILEWPIKYAKLFKNAPIKLPSGILLYGYPGTGKTLVGLSIPSLVNAKFIHIKGPELLSKYIGASEQAVQDVFKRARNSSPCIIFFDEFDSLVPRRGHDSTGVTDRVVNQFLAEMDGIEGGLGEGVYLIGATSRPDLIDPAVLRPGRLDKHLFFDLPNINERKEILKKLGREVNLNIDEDDGGNEGDGRGLDYWDEIGRKTEGFTGADCHSLVFSSQLSAVQEYLDKVELNERTRMTTPGSSTEFPCSSTSAESQGISSTTTSNTPTHSEITSADIPVTKSHLKETLSTFKPSLQGDEFKKFKYIYENFSGNNGTKVTKMGSSGSEVSWAMETGKRATLA